MTYTVIDEKTISHLKTVKSRVRWILENYPESRDEDTYVFILYWKYFDKIIKEYIPWTPMIKAAKPSTLRTARQRIQNFHKEFPPSPNSARARRRKAQIYRKAIGRGEV